MLAAAAPFRYLPAQVQFDLRVLKFFKTGDHGKLDIVAESFNVLNHTNVVAMNQLYGQESSSIPAFTTPNKAGIPRRWQFSIWTLSSDQPAAKPGHSR